MTRSLSAVVVLTMAGVACDNTATGSSPYDLQISVSNNFYSPSSVTIARGETVAWIGNGATHNVVFIGDQAGTPPDCPLWGLGPCPRRFSTAGTFQYFCSVPGHAGMVGQVIVNP